MSPTPFRKILDAGAIAGAGVGLFATPLGWPVAAAFVGARYLSTKNRTAQDEKAQNHLENRILSADYANRQEYFTKAIAHNQVEALKIHIMRSTHPLNWAGAFKAAGLSLEQCRPELEKVAAAYGAIVPVIEQVEEDSLQSASTVPAIGDRIPAENYIPKAGIKAYNLVPELVKDDRNVMLVACPGGGKTSFELAYFAELYDQSRGKAGVVFIDCKGSPAQNMGICHYLHCTIDEIPTAAEIIKQICQLKEKRQKQRLDQGGRWKKQPDWILLALGEVNDLLAYAAQYDQANGTKYATQIWSDVLNIARQGREERIKILMDLHSQRLAALKVKGVEMDAATRDNLFVQVALSRKGDMIAIDDAISYGSLTNGQKVEIKTAIAQYQKYAADKSIPVAMTTLGGARLLQLPAIDEASLYRPWRSIWSKVQDDDSETITVQAEVSEAEGDGSEIGAIAQSVSAEEANDSDGKRFSAEYKRYLASPEWQERRQRIKQRDRNLCQQCIIVGKKTPGTDVHHTCYPAWDAPFSAFVEQSDDDLRLLCKSCHNLVTQKMRGGK